MQSTENSRIQSTSSGVQSLQSTEYSKVHSEVREKQSTLPLNDTTASSKATTASTNTRTLSTYSNNIMVLSNKHFDQTNSETCFLLFRNYTVQIFIEPVIGSPDNRQLVQIDCVLSMQHRILLLGNVIIKSFLTSLLRFGWTQYYVKPVHSYKPKRVEFNQGLMV